MGEMPPNERGHVWAPWSELIRALAPAPGTFVCRHCGIVRPAGGAKGKPCPGPVAVLPRRETIDRRAR